VENSRSDIPRRGTRYRLSCVAGLAVALLFVICVPNLAGREKNTVQYGIGLIANVPFSDEEVTRIVQEIVRNGIIRGSKEYSKDEFISGAQPADSSRAFPSWTEGGKVFYKIRQNALDPQNFKNTSDTGTVAVRYVVQAQDDKHTVVRIDALFVDDFRHAVHPSNGSVESAEYKDIHDRLDSLSVMKTEAAEVQKGNQVSSSKKQQIALNDEPSGPPSQPPPSTTVVSPAVGVPPQTMEETRPVSLEQRVHDLKQQVERIVKAPGAPLKAAPFHSSRTLQALPSGTEVLIVISTPYWYGVETHEGQHGWMLRDELEMLP
jgi:hypothetical protein